MSKCIFVLWNSILAFKFKRWHYLSHSINILILIKCYIYICSVAQTCTILCNPMDDGLTSSSVHGILQARVLEQVAISISRGSSWPRDRTHVSCLADGFFSTEPPGNQYNEIEIMNSMIIVLGNIVTFRL